MIIPQINCRVIALVAREPCCSIPIEKKGWGNSRPWIVSIFKIICFAWKIKDEISELPKVKRTKIIDIAKDEKIWMKSINLFDNKR